VGNDASTVTHANTIRIATRGSKLALWQAHHVRERLIANHASLTVELVVLKTEGDRILDTPLAKIGGKGLFIKELEQALLAGAADLAVHSMKDVPVELPAALHIPAVLPREDPRDALVLTRYRTLHELPAGATIGTSSLRRRAQLAALRPDLTVHDLRGNVTTRLRKLTNGEFDGIALASAGLIRLGFADRIAMHFSCAEMLPAIGQGVIGIECRRGDTRIETLLATLECRDARDALTAERALNATLQGGCQVPIAGHATLEGEALCIDGLVASLDGKTSVRATRRGPRREAAALGQALGEHLLRHGAAPILRALGVRT